MAVSQNTLNSRLRLLLGVEPGEGRAVGLMAGLYFVLAAAFVFVQTTAFGLFIGEFGARNLPFAYLSVAVLASFTAYLYLKLSERVAYKTLLFANLGFLAAVCILFWLGLRSHLSHWVIFLLPFWFQTLLNLANLIVWPLAGRIFDVRQAKRLFGLVGAGNWLANILGGFVVAPILALMGTANVYLLSAAALLAAGFILWMIFNGSLVPAAGMQSPMQPGKTRRASQPPASPFQHPYSRLIFAYILLWWVSFYFIDNIFFDRAGVQFPSGAQLAAFLGRQLSVIGIIAIITTTLLTGRIIRRFGLRSGLLVMPVTVTFCTLLLAVGGALGLPISILFWIAAVAKTLNVAFGFSLSQAAGTLLYQPILGSERNRTQTIAEGIVQPAAIGVAALLLLLFNTLLRFNAVGLSDVFLPIGLLWLWVIYRLSREYPKVLSEALVKRNLGDTTTILFDPAGVAQLQDGLRSHRAGPVLYALNQLEALDPNAWRIIVSTVLPGLLAHPVPEVRRYVLERIMSLRLVDALPWMRARLGIESEPEVWAVLIRVLGTLGDKESADQITVALDSPERMIRQGAISGSLAGGDAAQMQRARAMLERLVASDNVQDRLMAAELLAETLCPGSGDKVTRLLADGSLPVRRAAVRAAGLQGGTDLLARVVAACAVPETTRVAEQVLKSKGAAALPAIHAALTRAEERSTPAGSVDSLIRVLGTIDGAEAADLLRSRMNASDAGLRLQVLRSLSALSYRARSMKEILPSIKSEVADAAWIEAAIQTLGSQDGQQEVAVLTDALGALFREARSRVMYLLSFALDAQAVLRAEKALDHAAAHPSGFALEAVDTMLPAGSKPTLLPLVENIPPDQRLSRWQAAGLDIPVLTIESTVGALIAPEAPSRFSHWARLCAIHVAGKLKIEDCVPVLQALSTAPDTSISEMSCWSLARIGFRGSVQGDAEMLSLVEKVLVLKSASLFGQTPDNVLADVAQLVQEISFDKDELVFNKGDFGDSLYILVSGKVQVWDGKRLLNELGEGDIFGELALLDPAPRSASVNAIEPTHLLQLDASHFQTILAERPEVPAAIIRVLTAYIRDNVRMAENMNADMKASGSSPSPVKPSNE